MTDCKSEQGVSLETVIQSFQIFCVQCHVKNCSAWLATIFNKFNMNKPCNTAELLAGHTVDKDKPILITKYCRKERWNMFEQSSIYHHGKLWKKMPIHFFEYISVYCSINPGQRFAKVQPPQREKYIRGRKYVWLGQKNGLALSHLV